MPAGLALGASGTAGVPGGSGLWMQPLGASQQEIKLEAGSHMVQLESGDLLHFYAAATPGTWPFLCNRWCRLSA